MVALVGPHWNDNDADDDMCFFRLPLMIMIMIITRQTRCCNPWHRRTPDLPRPASCDKTRIGRCDDNSESTGVVSIRDSS